MSNVSLLSLKYHFQMASPDICRVLVGNKSDLDDGRAVDTAKGKKASDWKLKQLNLNIYYF